MLPTASTRRVRSRRLTVLVASATLLGPLAACGADEATDDGAGGSGDPGSGHLVVAWSRAFPVDDVISTLDVPTSLAVSPADGAVALTGGVSAATDFGGGPVEASPSGSAYVAALGADGALRWANVTKLVTVEGVTGTGVAFDAGGGVAAVGRTSGAVDWGTGAMGIEAADSYFVRFDASGEIAAAVPFPNGSGVIALERLVLGTTGQLYASGWCGGSSTHFGVDCPDTGAGILVALDDDGAVLWARTLEGGGDPTRGGLAPSGDGGAWTTGPGGLVRHDASGAVVATVDEVVAHQVGTNGRGDVAVHGATTVALLDPSGRPRWTHDVVSGQPQLGGVAVDDLGRVAVTGQALTDLTLGPCSIAIDRPALFVAVFAEDGACLAAEAYRNPGGDGFDQAFGEAVAFAPDGSIVVKGWFEDALALGPTTHEDTDPNERSAFVARLTIGATR